MRTVIPRSTVCHLAKNRPTEISMPTVMKKRPMSSPLYGAMSLSTWSANSVSASSNPACSSICPSLFRAGSCRTIAGCHSTRAMLELKPSVSGRSPVMLTTDASLPEPYPYKKESLTSEPRECGTAEHHAYQPNFPESILLKEPQPFLQGSALCWEPYTRNALALKHCKDLNVEILCGQAGLQAG